MTTTATTPAAVTTSDEPNSITFEIAGLGLGLLKTKVKDKDRFWYAFRKGEKATMFGEQIPALADELPTSVVIDGVTISLAKGLSGTEKTPAADRRPAVKYSGEQTLPSLGVRTVSVSISETKNGGWNVKASATRVRSVSPEDRREAQAKKQEENLKALQALFSA